MRQLEVILPLTMVGLFAVSACGGDDSPKHPVGWVCTGNAACESNTCYDGRCATPCTQDTDCTGTDQCGPTGLGYSICLIGCDQEYALCENGRPVTCASATADHCQSCGCDGSLRCDLSGACLPPSDVGGNCIEDSDCTSGNCSTFAGVCRVPVGSSCTPDNCDDCLQASNFSFCSRECGSPLSGDCNGNPCLGNSYTRYYTCRPQCDSLSDAYCPNECRYDADYENIFCDCLYDGCPPSRGNRQVGQWCRAPSYCASGECYSRQECNGFDCISLGWCTTGCASDAECPSDARCVNIPCNGNATVCGATCLPTCMSDDDCERGNNGFWGSIGGVHVGACRSRMAVGGGQVGVCDVKLDDGASGCEGPNDCYSGECIENTCGYLSGSPNGSPCTQPSDCASNNCVTGNCRGTAMVGDSCSSEHDCAVGTCCTYGDHVNTCQSSCS